MSRTYPVLVVWLVAAVVVTGLVPALAATEVDPATLAPETVWAAMPTLTDVGPLLPQPKSWWPSYPEFYVGALNLAPAPGERFYLVQRFTRQAVTPQPTYLEFTVTVFKTRDAAHAAFRERADLVRAQGQGLSGPPLGNERAYCLLPTGDGRQETQLRYRVGSFVGRVSWVSSGPGSTTQLSKLGQVLADKLTALRYGLLTAPALPKDFNDLLPPARVEFEVGQPLLSLALAPQPWSMLPPSSPEQASQRLLDGGVTQVYYRRYQDNLLPGGLVDVTLWPFKDAAAATGWVQMLKDRLAATGAPMLPAGKTGPAAVLTYAAEGPLYHLRFAKGQYAADVIATAPFQPAVDSLAQISVQRMAERWYMSLPAPVILSNE